MGCRYIGESAVPMNITDMRRAEAGSCAAQSALGACYLHGEDVDTDYKEAFRYLSAAAEQGVSNAVLNLGHMYAEGLGVPQNMPEAIRLYESVGRATSSTGTLLLRESSLAESLHSERAYLSIEALRLNGIQPLWMWHLTTIPKTSGKPVHTLRPVPIVFELSAKARGRKASAVGAAEAQAKRASLGY